MTKTNSIRLIILLLMIYPFYNAYLHPSAGMTFKLISMILVVVGVMACLFIGPDKKTEH